MSETLSVASTMAAGAQSLRDTAKWLVGGVAATAAGVFAGSSLTAVGTLDPAVDTARLGLTAVGLLVGFMALSVIFYFAIRVLTRESMTFREMVTSSDAEIREIRATLLRRYSERLPEEKNLTKLSDLTEQLYRQESKTESELAVLQRSEALISVLTADGGFFFVRNRFKHLLIALVCATPFAIVGFGLFAWAANPPKPKTVPPAFSLTIQGPSQR
jgi:hypothetical protein